VRHLFLRTLSTLVFLFILVGHSENALAIPAFARKYETSCSTCHTAYPVLNAIGRAFKAAGYRIPTEDQQLIKDKPVSLGAPAWKQVFPRAVWPSDIPGGSVASFWLSSQFRANPSAPITNEFDGLNELYVLTAGTIGESFSFLAELEIINNGTVPVDFGAALPRAFIQYNHPSHKFNVTYGLFEPRAVLSSTRLRLIRIGDYLANSYGMPPTGNSFSLGPNQRGVELWGNVEGFRQRGGLEWFAGLVNGRDSGTPSGASAFGTAVQELNARLQAALAAEGRTGFENNSSKDFYVGANYKIGGMGVLGEGLSEPELQGPESYSETAVTLGVFYYRGYAPALVSERGAENLDRNGNAFQRTGAKAVFDVGNGNILAGLQLNRDRVREERNFDEIITLVEARYALFPWLIPAVRFENLNPNFGVAFNRTTLHGSILARANVRLSLEGVLSRNSPSDAIRDYRRYDAGNDSRFQFRLDFAY